MVNNYLKSIATVTSMFMASNAYADSASQTCETLSFGADFVRALQSNHINLFTDPNHEDSAFTEFLTNEAVRSCLNQAGLTHVFLEYNKDRDELFKRLREGQLNKDQFLSEYVGDFPTNDELEIQKIERLATLIKTLAESNIEAIAADDLATSTLSLMALMTTQQGFQIWSTLLPEEERQSFLNWTIHGQPVDEETKNRHLQFLRENSETDTFRNGQRMFDNAKELEQKGAIEERLDDRPTFSYISNFIEQYGITKFAIIRGEGHFSDQENAINNLFSNEDSNIFCLRSEFTQTPIPNICDYTINVSSYSFTTHMP